MPQNGIAIIGILVLFCKKGINECSPNICLTWKLSGNELTLMCKIPDIQLRVFISDPSGKTQAACWPVHPYRCDPYYGNIDMKYNLSSEEFIFRFKGETGYTFDGKWACHHGSSNDVSFVDVSVFQRTENSTEYDGGFSTSQHITTDFFFDRTTILEYAQKEKVDTENERTITDQTTTRGIVEGDRKTNVVMIEIDKSERIYYGLLGGGIVFLLVIFLSLNAFITRKCRTVVLALPQVENQTLRADVRTNDTENISNYDSSNYEQINENEMMDFRATGQETENIAYVDRKVDIPEYESIESSMSSSDKSYLDVIDDDYFTSCTAINIESDSSNFHVYSTARSDSSDTNILQNAFDAQHPDSETNENNEK